MASLKIHGGSFGKGHASYIFGNLGLPKLGALLATESIRDDQLDDVEVATEEVFRKMGSTIGLGVGGALLLGPLGLFVGALGGKRKEITFVARFADGRGFVGTGDAATFAKLKGAAMTGKQKRASEMEVASPVVNQQIPVQAPSIATYSKIDNTCEHALKIFRDFGIDAKLTQIERDYKLITASYLSSKISIVLTPGWITPENLTVAHKYIAREGLVTSKLFIGRYVGGNTARNAKHLGLLAAEFDDLPMIIENIVREARST